MKVKYSILLSVLFVGALQFLIAADSSTQTSQTTKQALEKQLDEERLAYQLYTALGEIHPGLRQFQKIPRAEARHFKALRQYAYRQYPDLETFELTGNFINPDVQKLYDTLLAKGKVSASAALQAGVAVEELDIRDLDAALEITTDQELVAIYKRLRAGSERHLAAFSAEGGGHGKGKGNGNGKGKKGGKCASKCNCKS